MVSLVSAMHVLGLGLRCARGSLVWANSSTCAVSCRPGIQLQLQLACCSGVRDHHLGHMKRHCTHIPTRPLCPVLLPACSRSWYYLVVQGWQCSSCISSHRLPCSLHVYDSTCAVGSLAEQDVQPVVLCTALQLLLVLEHVQRSAVSHIALDRSRGFEFVDLGPIGLSVLV